MDKTQANLLEWFDITNIEHIKAYDNINRTGVWPEGFIPDDMHFPHMWHILLTQKLANGWVEDVLTRAKRREELTKMLREYQREIADPKERWME